MIAIPLLLLEQQKSIWRAIYPRDTKCGNTTSFLLRPFRGRFLLKNILEQPESIRRVSRIKEFRAFYGEMKRRTAKLAADAGTGNLQKTSLSYGRVLEVCASCHAKFRD